VIYRVLQPVKLPDQRGRPKQYVKGQLVDILTRREAQRLLARGVIGPKEFSGTRPATPAAPSRKATKRVGIWVRTSPNYSGGRLHIYQYAYCLAEAGAEVYLITDGVPRWRTDYPEQKRLHVLQQARDPLPPDIDLCVTDSKGPMGQAALRWRKEHPGVPFVCFNFETPNWVREFAPRYADRLNDGQARNSFRQATLLIANSGPSGKYLLEWLERDIPCCVLPPAINTYALGADTTVKLPKRPYAVWSGRSADYKHADLALQAVWALDIPFDAVGLGQAPQGMPASQIHRFHRPGYVSDVDKFALMKGAHMVLAPSLFEGFGMVPMEALASGTPCIVYDLPVLRQYYGNRLIYVPWGDEQAYRRKVAEVAGEPKQDVSGKRSWVIRRYGMEAMAGRVEQLPYHAIRRQSVSVQLICYATPSICEAVEAVYPWVDEVLVSYGPTERWRDWPEGGVLDRLRAMPDPDGKLIVEAREVWADKRQMRRWSAERARGNRLMMLDADEIWVGFEHWARAEPKWGCPRWITYWHGLDHWVHDSAALAGRRWGYKVAPYGSVCPHYRWSWWRSTNYFRTHPTAVDARGEPLHDIASNQAAAERVPECMIHHLGHALPEAYMRRKHDFYLARDGRDTGRQKRMQVWHDWTGQTGDVGDGIVEQVEWEIPDIVRRAYGRIAPPGGTSGPGA
jgi:glycosyltransferase involved in cell wall biosynthesis